MELAAAVSVATLTTSRRLKRNFSYYRSNQCNDEPYHSRDSLIEVCNTLRMDLFGLQNLFLDHADSPTPFMVTLAGNIHDSFEKLHRNLLFYSAEYIEDIIPVIDHERSFWIKFTNHRFYDEGISEHIDTETLPAITQIKEKLLTFPNFPDPRL